MVTSESRLGAERKPTAGGVGQVQGPTQAEAQREKDAGRSRKERPAAVARVGRAGKAGQVTWVRCQGPGQIMQNLLGSWSGLDLF